MTDQLSSFIKWAREAKGLTQEELSQRAAVSQQSIAKWESGTGLPRVGNLKNLAKALEVDPLMMLKVRDRGLSEDPGLGQNDGEGSVRTLTLPPFNVSGSAIAESGVIADAARTSVIQAGFESQLHLYLNALDARGQMNQSISGPLGLQWIADYLSDKVIVNVVHLPSPRALQNALLGSVNHALWRLATLHNFLKGNRQAVLILHAPTDASAIAQDHTMAPASALLPRLAAEAALMNIIVTLAVGPKEAADTIWGLEWVNQHENTENKGAVPKP